MKTDFTLGQEVIVLDRRGEYELRGTIVGIRRSNPRLYDVQPNRQESLARRICGIPEEQLRRVGRPYLAYERRPEQTPKHILDEA